MDSSVFIRKPWIRQYCPYIVSCSATSMVFYLVLQIFITKYHMFGNSSFMRNLKYPHSHVIFIVELESKYIYIILHYGP